MNRIISFSLWGDHPKYTIGALENARLQPIIYPDWRCRFYIDQFSVPQDIQSKLRQTSEVIDCGHGCWDSMFWRFYAADDADIMISRDCDSRISERDRAAVTEWLASGKQFHIIRDHSAHSTKILGGMWGAYKGVIPNMRELVAKWYSSQVRSNYWQIDQNFLAQVIYPIVQPVSFVHDEFFQFDACRKPIAHARINREHIGQVFNDSNQPQTFC